MEKWNDERLDEAFKNVRERLDLIQPIVENVGVLGERLAGVSEALKAHSKKMDAMGERLDDISNEPIRRLRAFRSAMVVGLISGVFTIIAAILTAFLAGVFG